MTSLSCLRLNPIQKRQMRNEKEEEYGEFDL